MIGARGSARISAVAPRPRRRLAEQDHDLGVVAPSASSKAGLQGGARVEAGADGAPEPLAAVQRRRGGPGAPLRPRNSVRSAVHAVCRPPRSRNATRPANSVFHGLRARIAPVSGSISVTMCGAPRPATSPSAHSA